MSSWEGLRTDPVADGVYDGIVIGGGHNGLITAGYLARAGLKVLLVEAQVEVGGGLDSHEDPVVPGHWHNVHSVFHRGVRDLPWFRDLELDRFGVEYIVPPVGVAMVLPDDSSLIWHRDAERTAASIARRSPRDSRTFLDWHRQYQELAEQVAVAEMYAPPVPWAEKAAMLSRFAAGRDYLRWAEYAPIDVIREAFEDDAVRAFLAFLVAMRGFEVDAPGFGFFVPTMIATGVNPQLCRGSSHLLADALQIAVSAYGADILEASAVRRILLADGRAVGVELTDGRRYWGRRFVASSLNPKLTFLQLMDSQEWAPVLAERARRFRFSATTPIFAVNLALSQPPQYRAAAHTPEVGEAFMVIVGLWSLSQVEQLFADTRAGRWPRTLFMNGACPSLLDPSQAPPGGHTAFMWQLAPYRLWGDPGNWDAVGEAFADAVFGKWVEYAPNLARKGVVRNRLWASPLDIERHDANMGEGDWMIGELRRDQAFEHRPFPEAGSYRTPIAGLYLCGSSSHPYGNITGAPGYNAAGVIAAELGLPRWWNPSDVRQRWLALGEGGGNGGASL